MDTVIRKFKHFLNTQWWRHLDLRTPNARGSFDRANLIQFCILVYGIHGLPIFTTSLQLQTNVYISGCSRGDDSAESGGGGAGSSPRSEEGGVPLGVRGHTSSASVKSESPASPIPHGLHTPAHQVRMRILLESFNVSFR